MQTTVQWNPMPPFYKVEYLNCQSLHTKSKQILFLEHILLENSIDTCTQNNKVIFYSEADSTDIRNTIRYATSCIDPFDNDIIRVKALKSVSFVLDKFSQIANIEPKLTTHWHKRSEQLRQSKRGNTRNVSQHTLYGVQHIHVNLTFIHCTFYPHANADQNQFLQGLVFHCIRNEQCIYDKMESETASKNDVIIKRV